MKFAAAILLGLLVSSSGAAAADVKTDTQFWPEIDITAALTANLSATALAVSRQGEGLPNPTLAGGGATLDDRLGAWTFSVGDLDVTARSAVTGRRVSVNVPLAAVGYSWRIGDIAFSDRSRIEDLDGIAGNPWRYRNRLLAERQIEGIPFLSSVFVSDEVFYDLRVGVWSRNRAQFGIGVPLRRETSLQLYYMRQSDRSAKPGQLNILGAAVRIELR